ncbi:hypothetical protein AB0D34_30575 [Streptomyces sp. NPDC048420]|uniref:hypothetical protein n=1 Tax=Streptomyces sp. NPDC048420 TaxID=3155755 RepID=UPI003443C361
MRTAPAVPRAAVALCALAALALTGCSGGDSDSASGKASSKATVSADIVAYYSCLEKNGLTLETTDAGEPRVDKDKNDESAVPAAERKCKDLLPAPAPAASAISDKELAAARELSACVREKGIADYPDPNPTTGEVPQDAAAAAKSDPDLLAALQECTPGSGTNDGVSEG